MTTSFRGNTISFSTFLKDFIEWDICSDDFLYCIALRRLVTFWTHPEIIPVGQFFRRWINRSRSFRLIWLIDDKLTLTWLVYWIRTTRSVFTGAGLKWPNTAGQYRAVPPCFSLFEFPSLSCLGFYWQLPVFSANFLIVCSCISVHFPSTETSIENDLWRRLFSKCEKISWKKFPVSRTNSNRMAKENRPVHSGWSWVRKYKRLTSRFLRNPVLDDRRFRHGQILGIHWRPFSVCAIWIFNLIRRENRALVCLFPSLLWIIFLFFLSPFRETSDRKNVWTKIKCPSPSDF